MNGAHLHLLVNHLPVLGPIFGVLLTAYAWWRGGEELRRVALAFAAFAGLLALPAYYTGEPAEDVAEKLPGVTKEAIHDHEELAEGGTVAGVISGALALGVLALGVRRGATPRWGLAAVTVTGLVAAGWIGAAANLGGKIRHPEIESAGPGVDAEEPVSH